MNTFFQKRATTRRLDRSIHSLNFRSNAWESSSDGVVRPVWLAHRPAAMIRSSATWPRKTYADERQNSSSVTYFLRTTIMTTASIAGTLIRCTPAESPARKTIRRINFPLWGLSACSFQVSMSQTTRK